MADDALVRSAMEHVLASSAFAGSPRMSGFLRFVVEETLAGRAGGIKEYTIGIEVFGKPATYDPHADSAVRTEASKLRARLKAYYEAEGRADSLVITIPKGGYVPEFHSRVQPPRFSRRRAAVLAIVAIAIAIIGVAGLVAFRDQSRRDQPGAVPRLLTTYEGNEIHPSLSPDGSHVVFRKDGDLYVRPVDGEALVALTRTPEFESAPAWSPDGRHIAFERLGAGIFLISPLGGGERNATGVGRTPAWSPDSRSLAIARPVSGRRTFAMFLIDLGGQDERQLTRPPDGIPGDTYPAFSPDGRWVAFSRCETNEQCDVHVVATSGGPERRVTFARAQLHGFTWTDSRELIVSMLQRPRGVRLYRIPALGGRTDLTRLQGQDGDAVWPAISKARSDGSARLVYATRIFDTDIWRTELTPGAVSQKLIDSTVRDFDPVYSPDGKRIAFVSDRTGMPAIWISTHDGERLIQLTRSEDSPSEPAWSPDGQQIAYQAGGEIFLISSNGGPARKLVSNGSRNLRPSWSRDGRCIYFSSNGTGSFEIWRLPIGGGTPQQVTTGGGTEAMESPAGDWLYYRGGVHQQWGFGSSAAPLWRIPPHGGTPQKVLDGVWSTRWVPTRDGIVFVDLSVDRAVRTPLILAGPITGSTKVIAHSEKHVSRGWPGFSISPDGRFALSVNVQTDGADLMLIDNFR